MKIAICVSTRNRKEVFQQCIANIHKYTPELYGKYDSFFTPEFRLFTVDDASEPAYGNVTSRFTERAGIPRVKNRCIRLAMDWGATELFLFDDDCWPIKKHWYRPYIMSPFVHLQYTFSHAYQNLSAKESWKEMGHTFHSLSNGCMLYFNKQCIERVGGFRTEYGLGSYEHVDLSNRICAAGGIPHPHIDIPGSGLLFHSLDAHNAVTRSFTDQEKATLIQKNYPIFASKRFDTNFVPYADIPETEY